MILLKENRAAKSPVKRIDRLGRYGARAFSTLEGYASRNSETELAFPRRKRAATVAVLV